MKSFSQWLEEIEPDSDVVRAAKDKASQALADLQRSLRTPGTDRRFKDVAKGASDAVKLAKSLKVMKDPGVKVPEIPEIGGTG